MSMDPWQARAEDGPVVGSGFRSSSTFEGEVQQLSDAAATMNRRGWSAKVRVGLVVALAAIILGGLITALAQLL